MQMIFWPLWDVNEPFDPVHNQLLSLVLLILIVQEFLKYDWLDILSNLLWRLRKSCLCGILIEFFFLTEPKVRFLVLALHT